MDGENAQFRMLESGRQKRRGAMFRRSLGSTVLVFSYPRPAPRLFHTFFCPALRILALADDGQPLADSVWPANQFVRLPPTQLVVECDPALELAGSDLRAIAALAEFLDRKE